MCLLTYKILILNLFLPRCGDRTPIYLLPRVSP
nr:MAG TPA: hypothetical protein [Bacteriophage sp.]